MFSYAVSQGNECRRLLKNLDVLEKMLPPEHAKFLTTFRAFNSVVEACFSYDLADNYKFDNISDSYQFNRPADYHPFDLPAG